MKNTNPSGNGVTLAHTVIKCGPFTLWTFLGAAYVGLVFGIINKNICTDSSQYKHACINLWNVNKYSKSCDISTGWSRKPYNQKMTKKPIKLQGCVILFT
jgi:hypothetical protein